VKATISTRKALAIVLSAIVLTAIVTYVFAASSTIPFTIGGGIYPGAPSYTIWREGNYYFAKNSSGAKEFSGTNASQVIRSVINQVDRGIIYFTRGIYYLSGINSLINLNDKSQIILMGEGPANPASAPVGGDALPAGSTYGTLLVAPENFTGAIINITMSLGVTKGEIQILNLAIYGNTAWSTIKNNGGGYGIFIGNVRTINCRIEKVSVIGCKYGFYIAGSTIELRNNEAYWCKYGYYSSGEYINFDGNFCYIAYDYGFYHAGSGPASFCNNVVIADAENDFHTSGSGGTLKYHPIGFFFHSNHWVTATTNSALSCATGFYLQSGGSTDGSIVTSMEISGAETDSERRPNPPSYAIAGFMIYAEGYSNIFLSQISSHSYRNGLWLTVSGIKSNVTIIGSQLLNNTLPINTTLLAGTRDGTLHIYHSDFITQNTGSFSNISNGTYIAHGLAGTPDIVITTLTVQGYAWIGTKNSTHFQIYANVATISGSWYAEYKP